MYNINNMEFTLLHCISINFCFLLISLLFASTFIVVFLCVAFIFKITR